MSNLCTRDMLKLFENYDRVVEALASKRFIVIKYRGLMVYVFKGVKRDHLVSPCKFCTCEDFIVNYIGRNRPTPCYHVIGFEIAKEMGKLVELEVNPQTMAKIVEEIVFEEFSHTLRKLLKFA